MLQVNFEVQSSLFTTGGIKFIIAYVLKGQCDNEVYYVSFMK
jgi:hypothetical protein